MSFHWFKQDVVCYKLEGEILTDMPDLSPEGIKSLIEGDAIKEHSCLDRNELPPNKYLFVSMRLYGGEYMWEISDITNGTIALFDGEDRGACVYLKDYMDSVINIYLSDRLQKLRFELIEVDPNSVNREFNFIPSMCCIKNTSHVVVEISNPVRSICVYTRLLKGLVISTQIFIGTLRTNKSKIKRHVIGVSSKENMESID